MRRKVEVIKFMDLEELPGVGGATADKLKESGYKTVEAVAVAHPLELREASGLGESAAQKIINAARDSAEMGLMTGTEVLERKRALKKVPTGSDALDNLLGGGIETQSITEVFGGFGSGKTQLCLQLAVNAQLPEDRGGMGKTAFFLDTENTFRPERVKQMAEGAGLDSDEVLKNIFVGRAYNSDHQMLLAEEAEETIKEKHAGLVVVDSLTSHFRSDYSGRGMLAERQQKLNRHMHTLQRMSDIHNLAVVVTNQVMSRPDFFFGDPTTPIGGHIVGHCSAFRLYLKKAKGEKRISRLIDSPSMPEGEAAITVTGEGIRD